MHDKLYLTVSNIYGIGLTKYSTLKIKTKQL